MFAALLDGGFIGKEDIQPLCEKVEYITDSIEKGHSCVVDWVKILHDEYGIRYQ